MLFEMSHFLRLAVAVVAALMPPALIVWSRLAWGDALPDAIGTHWPGPGPADRATPTDLFFTRTVVVSAIGALVAASLVVVPRVPVRAKRLVALVAGGLSGVSGAQWLVSGALTMSAGDPYRAVLGVWILVHLASFAYGVIPALLVPADRAAHSPAPTRSAHISP